MDRTFRGSQLAKRGAAILSALLLTIACCVVALPATAQADPVSKDVAIADCTVIGSHDKFDGGTLYYIELEGPVDSVTFTDFTVGDMEDGMIFGLLSSAYYVTDTNAADINVTAQVTYESLADDDYVELDATIAGDLDYSNAYGYYVMTGDGDIDGFVIQVTEPPAPPVTGPFIPSGGVVSGPVEDGYTYTDYPAPSYEPVQKTADLYTLTLPYGTQELNLDFNGVNTLAYGYSATGKYLGDGAADKDAGYNILVGEATASFSTDAKGELPAYIWVQEPYDSSYTMNMRYVIHIEYEYTFTASVDGKTCEVSSFTPNAYEYYDFMAGKTITVGLYTVAVPAGTEEVDLTFSKNVLVYNYTKDGNYLSGAIADPYTGLLAATVPVDSEGTDTSGHTVPADGEADYIQIQHPYDAAYRSDLYYVITFDVPEPMSTNVEDIYLASRAYTNNVIADGANYSQEWWVLDAARDGQEIDESYYTKITALVAENDGKLPSTLGGDGSPTDYARTILALTAAGFNPTNVGGYDLTAGLADFDAIQNQGVNAALWTLMALDSHDYEIPEVVGVTNPTTRDKLVELILDNEIPGGGWDWMYDPTDPESTATSDPDLTAEAITALSLYRDSNPLVNEAVNRGLAKLSEMQTTSGGFSSWGSENADSVAEVVTALCSLGINPTTDERFIKDGKTTIDALCAYAINGGQDGFGYADNTTTNAMATYQAYRALIAYNRLLELDNNIYDMTDTGVYPLICDPVEEGVPYHVLSKSDPTFVLDVAYNPPKSGANVAIWTNNGGANQLFTFEKQDDGSYVIRNVANPELVLDAAYNPPREGSNVSTWTFNNGANQKWYFVQLSDEPYYVVQSAANPNLVLDAAGSSPSIGANVGLWTSNGGNNQQWTFEPANDLSAATVTATGMYRNLIDPTTYDMAPTVTVTLNEQNLVQDTDFELWYEDEQGGISTTAPTTEGLYVVTAKAKPGSVYVGETRVGILNIADVRDAVEDGKVYRFVSGMNDAFVLDVAYNPPKSGANVAVWTNNGGKNQLFTLEISEDGYYALRNVANDELVLDAAYNPPKAGANVSTWTFNEGANQKWVMIPNDDGTYVFVSAANNDLVLDVDAETPDLGSNVYLWNNNREQVTDGQRWVLTDANDLKYAKVETSGNERNYTGAVLEPEITVTANEETLVQGEDYTVKYINGDGLEVEPIAAGNYDVKIEGINDYSGVIYGPQKLNIYNVPEVQAGAQYILQSGFDPTFVMDVAYNPPKLGANVAIWTENGGDNQKFTMELQDSGYYVLRNVANTELVLDAAYNPPKEGSNVSTWTYNEGANQEWVLIPSEDMSGYYFIQSHANPDVVLDAAGTSPEIGANVCVWTWKGGANQQWKPVQTGAPELIDIADCTVTLTPETAPYTGEPVPWPAITVSYNGEPLVAERDYMVVLLDGGTSDGTSPGTILFGIGGVEANGYTGSVTATFTITEPAPQPVSEFPYSGDAVNFIKEDGSAFGMFAPQSGTTITIEGDNVVMHVVPKNKTTYAGFYLGADINLPQTWNSESYFALQNDAFDIVLPKSYCGKAWPIAPVKASDPTATTGTQYYLAIPALDKVPAPAAFPYDGDAASFIKADGAAFGMFEAQSGTTIAIEGDNVVMHYVPKNKTAYAGFYLNADIDNPASWDSESYFALQDGAFDIVVPKSYCGKAWPVAPNKASDPGATTGTQYYLAIPSEDKIPDAPELIDIAGATVTVTPESTPYTGQPVTYPTITVTYGGKTLVSEQDYQVAISGESTSDGTSVGTIVFSIAGVESAGYTGFTSATFTITESTGPTPVSEFAYDGDAVSFIKEDGSAFGMFAPQEGSTVAIEGDNVVMHVVPKNKTTYAGFYLGADINLSETWDSESYFALENEAFDIVLPKSYCGKAWPIAPVKVSDPTATTGTQYYLAIPAEDIISPPASTTYELFCNNDERMFKVVKAELEDNVEGQDYLVIYLSGSSYIWMFSGNQDDAVATFDDRESNALWAPVLDQAQFDSPVSYGTYNGGTETAESGYPFRVPVTIPADQTMFDFDIVAYATDFTARNFAIDLDALKLQTGSASDTAAVTVSSSIEGLNPASSGSLSYTGYVRPYAGAMPSYEVGLNNIMSNDFVGTLTIDLGGNDVYDQAYAVTYQGRPFVDMATAATSDPAAADYAEIFADGTLALPFYNEYDTNPKTLQLNGNLLTVMMHVADSAPYAEAGTWVARTFQLDFTSRTSATLAISGDALTPTV